MVSKNVGGLDRVFRIGIGSILAVIGFSILLIETLHVATGVVVLLLALGLLTTAATRHCLLNQFLDRNTTTHSHTPE